MLMNENLNICDLSQEQISTFIKSTNCEQKIKDEEAFFQQIKDFSNFIKKVQNISDFPIETLIWGYGNFYIKNTIHREDYNVVQYFYLYPRGNKITYKALDDQSLVSFSNSILFIFFRYINNDNNFFQRVLSNYIKRGLECELVLYRQIHYGIAYFLCSVFKKFGTSTILSKCCGATLYRSERVLKGFIAYYFSVHMGFSNRFLSFEAKENGIHFGIVAVHKEEKFCVKFHSFYPISIANVQETSINSDSTPTFSSPVSEVPLCRINPLHCIDVKELFAYHFLSSLFYGPEVEFAQDKNIDSYTLIITKYEKNFISFGQLKNNNNDGKQILKIFDSLRQKSENFMDPSINDVDCKFLLDLTCFDIVARCMLLSDLNPENYGFLCKEQSYTPFVVDFYVCRFKEDPKQSQNNYVRKLGSSQNDVTNYLYEVMDNPKYRYAKFDIFDNFMDANNPISYNNMFIPFFKPPFKSTEKVKLQQLNLVFERNKINYGSIAIEMLEDNGFVNHLADQREKFQSIFKDLGFKHDSKIDLDYYIESIKWNFKYLKKQLNDKNHPVKSH